MFDKEAIEDIQLAHAVEAADASLSGALGDGTGNQRQDAIALPDNFKLHDIEHLKPTRRRARGLMRTRLLAPFAAYVKAKPGDGSRTATCVSAADQGWGTAVSRLNAA